MDDSENAASPDPLFLTAEESDLLHRVACQLVAAAANKTPRSISDFPLGRLVDYPLVGTFVTLRKRGDLRGCIGNLAAATPLGQSLERAANGVASHDPRFPPVTPAELSELTLSVSLLHTRELLDSTPQQRATAVAIGQHGLDIQLQGRKGLLLPSVATDCNMDPLQFLQAVCRKAGLHEDAWCDPDAVLYRFSAVVVSGPYVATA